MADRVDEFGDVVEDDEAGDTAAASTDAGGDSASGGSGGDTKAATAGGEDLRKWQSKADAEAARANRLQKELDALRASSVVQGGTAPAPESPVRNGADPWVEASKGNFRDELFKSDPRFAALGFEASLIQGSTPGEMKQSFDSLVGTVDRMESSMRNRILIEHGLEPDVGGGERATAVNYGTMPKEEFDKLVERALGG